MTKHKTHKPHRGLQVTVAGRDFISVAAAARAYGEAPTAVHSRLASGWTIDRAVGVEAPQEGDPGRLCAIVFEGTPYRSLSALARAKGLDPKALHTRLHQGMALEDALARPVKPHSPKAYLPIRYQKRTFENLKSFSRATGLSVSALEKRLEAGLSPSATVAEARAAKAKHDAEVAALEGIVVRGKPFPSLTAVAKHFGIELSTLVRRIQRGNRTVEQAVAVVRGARPGRKVTVGGVEYPSMFAAARARGTSYGNTVYRMARGLSIEEALDPELKNRQAVTIAGTDYPSIFAALRAYGTKVSTYTRRRRAGWPVERAITEKARHKGGHGRPRLPKAA